MTSPKRSRGFLAVVPPDHVLSAIEEHTAALAFPAGVRNIPRSKWHFTIRFLGDRVRFDETVARLDGAPFRSATAQVGGGGAFPNARRADVLWIGLTGGARVLGDLAETVDRLLDPALSAPGSRFHPHLTLAPRPIAGRSARRRTCDRDARVGSSWSVDELVLFESVLGAGPAIYEVRGRFPLRP